MPRFILLFKNRFVYTILLSNLFSQLGIWIRNFAVLLYVMEKSSGDTFAVSMISVAEYAPIFVFLSSAACSRTDGVQKERSFGVKA